MYNNCDQSRSDSGGYEYDFVDTIPPKYNCNICLKVLRDAQLTVCCGQHYCDTCLKEWLNSKAQAGKNTCPHCREENFQSFPNKAIIREIKEFKIRCVHKEKGCAWVGEMGTLKDHLSKSCGCVKVKCRKLAHKVLLTRGLRSTLSVASMCGATMERRHLTHHQKNECLYRLYKCQHCGYIDTYDAIAGSGKIRNRDSKIGYGGNHYSQCDEYPLKCPNTCGAVNIKRKDMKTHRENCPLEPIKCPFSEVCNKYFRKHIEDHKKECDFRPYQCEHCGHNGTYLSISGEGQFLTLVGPNHYDECEQYPLQCPNKCGADNIKRKDMKTHRDACPMEPLDCPFQHVGCSAGKILRKDMDSHCKENIQTHLLLVVQSSQELARKNEELGCKHEELVHKNEEFEKRIQVLEARRD